MARNHIDDSVEAHRARGEAYGFWLGEWLRVRVLGMALSFAAMLTFLSLFTPSWLDFFFDILLFGAIWVVGKLARRG